MPEPIVWTIQDSLKTDLEGIDGTGTYFFTASSVAHHKGEQQDIGRNQFVIALTGIERGGPESQGRYAWVATFEIAAVVTPSTSLPDDQLRARLWSDIQTAVMANPKRTVSSTDYAVDTQVLGIDIADRYDERVNVSCQVAVAYRTQITDPTSL